MRTLVVSDLHLGGRRRADVLVDGDRTPLIQEVGRADRLVLLGDTLELRHGPMAAALARARPLLEELGATLPREAEVVLVAGNHDHALVAPWLAAERAPLGLERRIAAADASPAAQQVAAWLGAARTEVAYPGVWLREDVYAMHGHYADPHGATPTFERLAIGAVARLRGLPSHRARADDYERLLAPIYASAHAAAQRATGRRLGAGAGGAGRAYAVLTGGEPDDRRRRALRVAFPLGVAGLRRLGLGALSSDLSPAALRRDALRATGEAVERLGIEAEHVVFGHSHRAGPLPADDPAEWRMRSGARLHNCGCWVHEPVFSGEDGRGSPYWPGHAVLVEDAGPPRVLRLPLAVDGVRRPEPGPA